jgi:serine/threonine protein kinase
VARVLDVGTLADGIPFIVMEYLEGRDLATLLERDGPLPIVDAIDFILQACEALAEATATASCIAISNPRTCSWRVSRAASPASRSWISASPS